MSRRWVEGLVVLGLVVSLVGGALLYASQSGIATRADQAARLAATQAEELRKASLEDCRRSNDVRRDLRKLKGSLLKLVSSVLVAGGPGDPETRHVFERVERTLRQPVPSVSCRTKYPKAL